MPPPGEGFETVTVFHSNDVNWAAGTTANSCVALTYEVGTCVPPNNTVEAFVKPEPVTVIVVSFDPERTAAGLIDVATGAGEYVLPLIVTVALA